MFPVNIRRVSTKNKRDKTDERHKEQREERD